MSDKACDSCGHLFEDKDLIVAEVLSRYKSLKSKRTFAIETPAIDCYGMRHDSCNNPKGGISENDYPDILD